jgi:hypothetical protein
LHQKIRKKKEKKERLFRILSNKNGQRFIENTKLIWFSHHFLLYCRIDISVDMYDVSLQFQPHPLTICSTFSLPLSLPSFPLKALCKKLNKAHELPLFELSKPSKKGHPHTQKGSRNYICNKPKKTNT